MSLKWIKLDSCIFFDERMLLLEECENFIFYQMVYMRLLCLAGRKDASHLMLANGKPCPIRSISRIIRLDERMTEEAIDALVEVGLLGYDGEALYVTDLLHEGEDCTNRCDKTSQGERNDSDDVARERQRAREGMRRLRERRRALANDESANPVTPAVTECNSAVTSTVTDRNTTVTSLKYLSLEENREEKSITDKLIKEERDRDGVGDKNPPNEISLSLLEEKELEVGFSHDTDNVKSERMQVAPLTRGEVSAYGTFSNVYLSGDEYARFIDMYKDDYTERIDELSVYIAQTGKEYKNHLAALMSFARLRKHTDLATAPREGPTASDTTPKKKQKWCDIDPEEALRNAIQNSGFFDDDDVD